MKPLVSSTDSLPPAKKDALCGTDLPLPRQTSLLDLATRRGSVHPLAPLDVPSSRATALPALPTPRNTALKPLAKPPPAPVDKTSLLYIRQERIDRVRAANRASNESGPRFVADTAITDTSLFREEARRKARHFVEGIRREMKAPPRAPEGEEEEEPQMMQKAQSVLELVSTSAEAQEIQEPARARVNRSFGNLMALDEESLLTGEIYNSDTMIALMPEGKLKEVVGTDKSSLLMYAMPRNERGAADTLVLPVYIPKDRERLTSQVVLPKQGRLVPRRVARSESTLSTQSTSNIYTSGSDLGGGDEVIIKKERTFWADFEILLERQTALELEALSSLASSGQVEHFTKSSAICRFGRDDVAQLTLALFGHLKNRKDRPIGPELARTLYGLAMNEQDSKVAFDFKTAFLALNDKRLLLEIKALTGHLKRYEPSGPSVSDNSARIALVSMENRSKMKLLVRGLCNLLGPLFVDIGGRPPVVRPPITSPGQSIEAEFSGDSFHSDHTDDDLDPVGGDLDKLSVERLTELASATTSAFPSGPYKLPVLPSLNTPTPLFIITVSDGPSSTVQPLSQPKITSFAPLYHINSPVSTPRTPTLASVGLEKVSMASRAASALHRKKLEIKSVALESEQELRLAWDRVDAVFVAGEIFDNEAVLCWQGRILDILIRFWDFIHLQKAVEVEG